MPTEKRSLTIPWSESFYEALSYFRKPDRLFMVFLFLFFLLSIPNQSDLPDWKDLDRFQSWLWGCAIVVYLAVSYYVYIAFLSWIKDRSDEHHKPEWMTYLKKANELMIPLSIISIRGAILASLGILLLVIPGIYFYFKYQVVALCLVFEGWREDLPPIQRTEQLMRSYGPPLFLLAIVSFIEPTIPWILEFVSNTNTHAGSYTLRMAITVLETGLTFFCDLYFSILVLSLLKATRTPLKT